MCLAIYRLGSRPGPAFGTMMGVSSIGKGKVFKFPYFVIF